MQIPIYLPRLAKPGIFMCECKRKQIDMEYKTAILTWRINPGEYVYKDDVVCEAEVEKSVIEILSPANGRLAEICVQDGETSDIQNPIGYIDTVPIGKQNRNNQ